MSSLFNGGFLGQYDADENLSGGQRLNKALAEALRCMPDVLLLDEPTNHLDGYSRQGLMRMLNHYAGTLIMVSHDADLIKKATDTLWHVDDHAKKIRIFSGDYEDYKNSLYQQREFLEKARLQLDRQKKDVHRRRMQEQTRAAKSKVKGRKSIDQRKWPTVVSKAKVSRALETTGRRKAAIDEKKQRLSQQRAGLYLPDMITPRFSITTAQKENHLVLSISKGAVGYTPDQTIIESIYLSMGSQDRWVLRGANGSGKSTFFKALISDERIFKTGEWAVPPQTRIGYLDQHYSTLDKNKTVLESVTAFVPDWPLLKIRRYLNDFLFRSHEEVHLPVWVLSEGEKARLSLAQLAVFTPPLLLLDEMTNNLDNETKSHVAHVLRLYPGAMIIISHDTDFLKDIAITDYYEIKNSRLLQEKSA